MAARSVLVVGGSGFVGRHIVNRLAAAGHRIVVPTRRRDNARALILLPTVDVVDADVNDAATLLRLARGMDAVINLVGILNEKGGETFAQAHLEVTKNVIAACNGAAVRRLVHMSALNADPEGPSRYLRTKGEAETAIVASGLDWTIFQPSVIFGREDSFLNLFAKLLRLLPVVALAGAHARFQPAYVGDVADCFVRALDLDASIGRMYPLCGPKIYTLRELVRYVGEVTGAERPIVPLGRIAGRLQALILEMLPGKLMSRDNLASMELDSVCGCDFPALFGVKPTALEAVAPEYLSPDAARSRYDAYRTHGGR
ncbi:MAG: complex I NDUFA9 subunit family protein [Aromatoleum sp.]|nr:complex I NDUFA9 subunit family protein [Aromatoleum sp.]